MITFDDVRKAYGDRRVLEGVSLEILPGRITALVGPNGSGKTTLMKILLGLARADSGTVRVAGATLDGGADYRRIVGYMPQAARFPEHLRVREVFELVAALRPGAPRDTSLSEEFGLDAEWDRPVGRLSGGTRQKVNAAIAFLFAPPIIILDEPTAGLDPLAARVLRERIRRDRAQGRLVIVTSHVISELEDLADDVAFLCDGHLQFAGAATDLLARTGASHLEAAIVTLMRANAARPATRPASATPYATPAEAP
jgi:Cu-processing system ATP-binding protein